MSSCPLSSPVISLASPISTPPPTPNPPTPNQTPNSSPVPSPVPSLDYSSDNNNDLSFDEGDDDFGIPIERPPSRPMVNFSNDTENENDYAIGWEWLEVDPGPLIAPYNGFRQCLLDPTRNKPEDFFNALFEDKMYTIMAEETNKYAQ